MQDAQNVKYLINLYVFYNNSHIYLGASSITFWLRLCIEHSLSLSHTAPPCLSHNTCISICLGLSINFSINILSSPKLDAASWEDNLMRKVFEKFLYIFVFKRFFSDDCTDSIYNVENIFLLILTLIFSSE